MPSTQTRRSVAPAFMKYVPNALTISRIVVTPLVLAALLTNTLWGHVSALILFVLAAISDYVDGRLAREYELHSRLGQFLDPFADKVLVLGTFVTLWWIVPEIVPWWAVVLIALRDALVTGMRTWAETHGRSIPTLRVAKWKTTVQLVFLIGMLVLFTTTKLPWEAVQEGGRWVLASSIPYLFMLFVVAFTVYTGVVYVRNTYASPAQMNG